jgi:hypothetical protein
MTHRTRNRTIGLTAAGALVVAVHLGLGGSVLAAPRWTGWAIGSVLVAILVKVVVLGRLGRGLARAFKPGDAGGGTAHRHAPHLRKLRFAAHTASPAGHLRAVAGFLRRGRRRNPVSQKSTMRSEARVPTPRGERYAKQLCAHAARMAPHAEWTPPEGVIEFPDEMGTCRVIAEPDHLVLTVEATDPANLATLQQIISRNIERFGGREGLKVEWVQDRDR